jgi:hypothetical protein
MLFKHPSLLYGLFFLAIPIIVHLFQLRRFSKVDFTNVAFLKPLAIQTRKSRQLKKWLTLIARLLAVACLVLAFCQPFLPGSDTATKERQTVFYLDNSFSMQAQGSSGELYKSAVTDLLKHLPPEKEFSLFTNDAVFKNTTRSLITNDLLNLGYSSKSLSINQVLLKYQTLLADKETVNELVMVSDFHALEQEELKSLQSDDISLVRLNAESRSNIAIDSAFITDRKGENYELRVLLKSTDDESKLITVSLFNRGILQGKTSVTLENNEGQASLNLSSNEPFQGQISIEDEGLTYDNQLFINTIDNQKIKVLAVNGSNGDFLKRIYDDTSFDLLSVQENELNYNLINEQNLIVLNELSTLPDPLVRELREASTNGTRIIIIPNDDPKNYQNLLPVLNINRQQTNKKITTINYDHPLVDGVFNKRVSSFQYPSVEESVFTNRSGNSILAYQDGNSFLFKRDDFYIFTAPLNEQNSNFQNSPLIVPIFYNIGIASLPLPKLYYEIGQENKIAIPTTVGNDQVLRIQNEDIELIPRQQAFSNNVVLQITNDIETDGYYQVANDGNVVSGLSFNYSREESYNSSSVIDSFEGRIYKSVQTLIKELEDSAAIHELWRYFIMAVLFFLLCEILILKFVK